MRKDKVVEEVLGEENAITPSDVFSKQFKRSRFSGYDRKDVDDFLEHVADALENLVVQMRVLKEKSEEQRKLIAEFREVEASLRNAMVASQRFGDDVLESAKREAHVILEEARLKRAQAQLDVSRVPAALSRDIHILEQQRSRLRVEMMAIIETHRKLLDSLVPEDALHTPASFFDVGPQEKRLTHEDKPVQLAAPEKQAPEPAGEAVNAPAAGRRSGPVPAGEPVEPSRHSGDHVIEGLEDLVDPTPPVHEDVEDLPEEPLR